MIFAFWRRFLVVRSIVICGHASYNKAYFGNCGKGLVFVLSIFLYAFHAVAPVLLLALFGYVLKRKGVLSLDFLKTANSFAFRYCLSIQLFYNVYSISDLGDIPWGLVLFSIVFVLVMFVVGMLGSRAVTADIRQRGVLAQCPFRSNVAIIGLSITSALGNEKAVAISSILIAVTVMLYNTLAVICLTVYSEENLSHHLSIWSLLHRITQNPLIRGIAAGMLCLVIRSFLPRTSDGNLVFSLSGSLPAVYTTIQNIAKMASPLMIIILGGEFSFSAVHNLRKQIFAGVFSRLILSPVVGYILIYILSSVLGLFYAGPAEYAAMVGILASPVAASSAVMAEEMGADEILAGQIVVWSSLFSTVTIFLIIVVLRSLALL